MKSRALILGLAAALAFAALAGARLDGQGPQYDELHQAVGAFTWLGAPPPAAFCLDFHGICVLNTTYSAAIKTNLYGLFLRLSGRGFTLRSWRWSGILTVAAALLLLATGTGTALGSGALALLLALLLSDGSLLLLGRFDWGPVDLSFLLRALMIGVWLRGESAAATRPANSFALGALAGFATFEKLSSCLLVLPLAAILLAGERRRSRRHLAAAALGLAAGALPLALVNLGWFLRQGELISLRDLGGGSGLSIAGFSRQLLSLGYGGGVRPLMLGLAPSPRWQAWEAGLLAVILLLVGGAARRWRDDPALRRAGVALVGYLAIGVGLYALPRPTWAHHWLLGTPFQYLALALALHGLLRRAPAGEEREPHRRRGRRATGLVLALLATGWIGLRLAALVSVERALERGSSSEAWDPSLARLGAFAARHRGEAVFVASDWGVATQILCFAQGAPGLIVEPFWHEPAPAPGDLAGGAHTLYLVRLRRGTGRFPATARIERDLAADPRWREVPPEPEAALWRAVLVRKFLRREPAGRERGAGGSV